MTALLPASCNRAPEPININFTLPVIQRIHSQMRLSDAPARGVHQAQPAQGCRPRPVQSHPPPRKLVATTTAIRWSTQTNDFLANEPFSFTASIPTRSYSFFASFFIPQNFSSPTLHPRFKLGVTHGFNIPQHISSHQTASVRPRSVVSKQHGSLHCVQKSA